MQQTNMWVVIKLDLSYSRQYQPLEKENVETHLKKILEI